MNNWGKIICLAVAMNGITTPETWAADTGSTSIDISGDAKPVCRFPSPSNTTTSNANFDGSKMVINQLLDDTNATVKESKIQVTYSGVMCNYNAYLVLTSTNGAMIPVAGTGTDTAVANSGTFLKRIDYKVQATWGSVAINNFDTTNHTGQYQVGMQATGANSADLVVDIFTENGNIPVLQGQYADTLTIKVGSSY